MRLDPFRHLFLFASLCSIFPLSYSQVVADEETTEVAPLLVLLIQSFRWDFVYRIKNLCEIHGKYSYLWSLVEEGAYAPSGISSVFSTGSLSNQYTLATGLYPESHGVVSNSSIHDPILNQTANLQSPGSVDDWVLGGEPIWKTFSNQSNDSVACYNWFGCGYGDVKNYRYLGSTSSYILGPTVTAWLQQKVKLILISYPELGARLSSVGPSSPVADQALLDMDEKIGMLVTWLKVTDFYNRTNLIILGDEGITESIEEKAILPSPDALPPYFNIRSNDSTVCQVDPELGHDNETVQYFHNLSDHLQVFRRVELSEELHFKISQRISPIIVMAKPGYSFHGGQKGIGSSNNSMNDMRAAFIGHGPSFIPNSTVPSSVSTVDVYGMATHLLNVTAAPNNGSKRHFDQFISNRPIKLKVPRELEVELEARHDDNSFFVIVVILAVALVLGVLILGWLCHTGTFCRSNEPDDEIPFYITSEITPLIGKQN